jgi:murein DD-endopeptidase MepM/ murein hydrolase activator NlpD
MVCTTTREGRGERWRFLNIVAAAVLAFSTVQYVSTTDAAAQVATPVVKPPVKKVAKAPSKVTKQQAPASSDSQEADQLNAKWLADHNAAEAAATAAATNPAAVPTANAAPNAPGTAPTSAITAGEEDKFMSVPSFGAPVGSGARAVLTGSITLVKANSTAAFNTVPGGSSLTSFKEVAQAFSGFGPAGPGGPKVEMVKGQTADGTTRLLYASIGEGKSKQSYWWFAPSDQPEGWFDDKGDRLGGTILAEPKPDARISSPFGTRRYYGRVTSTAFHNGIDFEAHMGDPIHAAADGIVNHANWYYNYGRTVKITHAENFETLYAHMSRIAPGITPGTAVHKGDVIGFVGSTGRSTGPHLHFSTIVNGQFVDPAQFLSENGSGQLNADSLVSFRQWQQDIRVASQSTKPVNASAAVPSGLHGGQEQQTPPSWSTNPFGPKSATSGVGHL